MQDMRIAPGVDRTLSGGTGATFQRLPALFAQIAPMQMGQATFSLEASAVQFTRFRRPDEQERTTGFGQTDRVASLAPGGKATNPARLHCASILRRG